MELITILNRCHRFRGFVYHRARFSPDHKSIEISVRPRKGSAAICSRCHQPARGYEGHQHGSVKQVAGRVDQRRNLVRARKIAILDLFQAATICDADFR
jgi:hypothetical protein